MRYHVCMSGRENTEDIKDTKNLDTGDVTVVDEHLFQDEVAMLLKDSENFRLEKMKLHRSREFLSLTLTLAALVFGGAGFGWFFLVAGNLLLAILCIMIAILPHFLMSSWVRRPVQQYRAEYKSNYMPRLAKILGGFKYYPHRGISKKVLSKTGIVPAHDKYRAEDCFIGSYKGAKISFSEARMTGKKHKNDYVFDGLFVLIELNKNTFEGHSVITADGQLAKRLMPRLPKLINASGPFSNQFTLLSTSEANKKHLDNNHLLKELSETMALFGEAQLSAAFFAKKYIFIMIPCKEDMFEASDVYVPITTSEAAFRCKKEIEQITSIVDIIDIYQDDKVEKTDSADDIRDEFSEEAEPKSPPEE